MRVLIVEDEKPAADKLRLLLKKTDASIQVTDVVGTVEHAVNWLRINPMPDLIFMDIQLSDGISFEIFKHLKITVPIIFVTAFDEYAIQAFKLNSIDYLLKPLNKDDLTAALQKYHELYPKNPVNNDRIANLFDEQVRNYRTRFLVKAGLQFKSVFVDDIDCFFVKEHCTFLRSVQGRSFDLDYSLEQIQGMVAPESFFRINRNYMVNIHYISTIHCYSSSRLKVELKNKTDEELIVSREKVSDFKEWLNK